MPYVKTEVRIVSADGGVAGEKMSLEASLKGVGSGCCSTGNW